MRLRRRQQPGPARLCVTDRKFDDGRNGSLDVGEIAYVTWSSNFSAIRQVERLLDSCRRFIHKFQARSWLILAISITAYF